MAGRGRQKKSWVRRRRRMIKRIIALVLLLIIGVVAGFLINASFPYEEADLCDMFSIVYGGYETTGTAEAVMNDAVVDELLSKVKEDYDDALIHLKKVDPEDYVNFRSSLNAVLTPAENLSNGSIVTMTVMYDKKLAEKLKIDVISITRKISVNSLLRATTISNEQLFEDVSVSFSGISPTLTASVVNSSAHPFLQSVVYEIVEPREYYAEGDTVEVCAFFDPDEALNMQYVVDESENYTKVYTATSNSAYVTNYSDVSNSIIQEAVSAGTKAFTNANEYGVRIFCEGHLVPVYINKQATFVWGSPRAISAYFKTVFPEHAGKLGNNYNDLDIIYEVPISQADGTACKSYCVVRFSNFVKNGDGSISYDFSNPKIISASYFAERVRKNVVDSYVNKYDVNKVL